MERKSLFRMKKLVTAASIHNWDPHILLYESIISTTLYGAEAWGSKYYEELEIVNVGFHEALPAYPRNTPGYMLR